MAISIVKGYSGDTSRMPKSGRGRGLVDLMVRVFFTVGFKSLLIYNNIIHKLIQFFYREHLCVSLPHQPELRYTSEKA